MRFTCDDIVQHKMKDRKTGMVSVHMLQMLQSNIQPQMIRQVMVSHSNISSSTAQFDQVFSHPKDNKVGNVICIHCSPPDHQGKSTHSFQPQLSQSVMSLTSYSNKTACEITITKLIKQIFSCHLLVKSQNIPACRYESN